MPVYPGYPLRQLSSSIKHRTTITTSCPLGPKLNADLVLFYYYDDDDEEDYYYYYYPEDGGRRDGDNDGGGLLDDVEYTVAVSTGRCFAEVRTVRTHLGEEERKKNNHVRRKTHNDVLF